MASISQPTAGQGDSGQTPNRPGVRFERVGPDKRRLALGVLLTGRANERDAAIDRFLHYSRDEGLALDELWLAWENRRAVAATLIVPCPGRTAMQFVGPDLSRASADTAATLFHHAAAAQDPGRIALIQALLEPGQQHTRNILADAGFEELAVLSYMRTRATEHPHRLELEIDGARVMHWAEGNRSAFARAILASYENTLDCPALLGRRHIDDIIAGHMATGFFRAELWHAIYRGDDPVGVMLMNEAPLHEALELVYLGLAPPWRGRGLGRRLVRYGLGQGWRYRRSSMILAVDERNEPALRLYRGLGFRRTGRKRAMIFTLPANGGYRAS